MKFKINDEVMTVYGIGTIVFIDIYGDYKYLVKIEGHKGHDGIPCHSNEWNNVDGLFDKGWFTENGIKLIGEKKQKFTIITTPEIFTMKHITPIKPLIPMPRIMCNEPATIILWPNGDKTVVKCLKGETYDKVFGVALAFLKYHLGNNYKASKKAYQILMTIKESI